MTLSDLDLSLGMPNMDGDMRMFWKPGTVVYTDPPSLTGTGRPSSFSSSLSSSVSFFFWVKISGRPLHICFIIPWYSLGLAISMVFFTYASGSNHNNASSRNITYGETAGLFGVLCTPENSRYTAIG